MLTQREILSEREAAQISPVTLAFVGDAVYSLYGKRGVSHTETIPDAKTVCDGEDAHFHIRHGNHYLSREDWNAYMDFIDSKI